MVFGLLHSGDGEGGQEWRSSMHVRTAAYIARTSLDTVFVRTRGSPPVSLVVELWGRRTRDRPGSREQEQAKPRRSPWKESPEMRETWPASLPGRASTSICSA
ncbi:hypothetical protein GQ53DRAFT_742872 [Thozetella sp. PMI_491]|nr:hypothetical protein GQ53DRAFT_742872 [Thozetella sp. PMI_491]